MLIGQNLPDNAGDAAGQASENLVFQLPAIPAEWQFLIDVIPAQLVADKLAALSGVDCDTFRLCSFVVEDDGGLLPKNASGRKRMIGAVDIGGTKIAAGIVDDRGKVLSRLETPTTQCGV